MMVFEMILMFEWVVFLVVVLCCGVFVLVVELWYVIMCMFCCIC